MDELDFDKAPVTTRLSTPASRLKEQKDRIKLNQLQSRVVAAEASPMLMAILIQDAMREQDVEVRHKLILSILAYGVGKPAAQVDEDSEKQRNAVAQDMLERFEAISRLANQQDVERKQIAAAVQPQNIIQGHYARHPLADIVDVEVDP